MLKGLLENKTCAKCRVCCGFDKTDLWEMPVMDISAVKRIKELHPDADFQEKGNGYLVKAPQLEGDELYFCPALGENGCVLENDKPFDCRIWPYRIMDVSGKKAITISPVCNELYNRPLSSLIDFLDKGLADFIFDYAEKHPEVIKKYDKSYPVLKFETE